MKRNILISFLITLSLSHTLLAVNPRIRKVMTIGEEERDDYMFFCIADADMSPDGSIFVVDKKGAFVSKFDKDGNFVKRVGQRGRGPTDFFSPGEIQIFDDHIFILDFLNGRIACTDLDLNEFNYYRTAHFTNDKYKLSDRAINTFRVLGKDRLLFTYMSPKALGIDSFYFSDHKLRLDDNFFIFPPQSLIKTHKEPKFVECSLARYDVSRKNKRILAASMVSNNPIDFHLYDFSGKLLKHFSYQLPEDIGSAYEFIRGKNDSKKRFNLFLVTSIQAYRDYFFVFIEQNRNISVDREDRKNISEPYALIFDTNGKYLGNMPLEITGTVFSISGDGHLLMLTKMDPDEAIKLTIYRMIF